MAVAGYFVGGTRWTKLGLFPNGGWEIQKLDILLIKSE